MTLVIGIGHRDRGDDAAGPMVVDQLGRGSVLADCTGLIDLWEAADEVVVVDAMRSGDVPGAIFEVDASEAALPTNDFATTHSFGLAETVELARALNRLPARLRVIGIEGVAFDVGAVMTPAVTKAVAVVAAMVRDAEV